MKNIAVIALFVAATFITAGSASAQEYMEKANVPFNFTVGNRSLPAGVYTIRSKSNSPHILSFSNPQNNLYVVTSGQPDQSNPKRVSALEFHRYGNQYFLSEVRSANGSMNVHFIPSKAEKSARTQIQVSQQHVDDPDLVALK